VADLHVTWTEVDCDRSSRRRESRPSVAQVELDRTGLLVPRDEIELTVVVDVGEEHLSRRGSDIEG
jgi:hypothetical protein